MQDEVRSCLVQKGNEIPRERARAPEPKTEHEVIQESRSNEQSSVYAQNESEK